MGGKMKGAERIHRKNVKAVVDDVFPTGCGMYPMIAGSYRREKTTCGDIDVVLPVVLLEEDPFGEKYLTGSLFANKTKKSFYDNYCDIAQSIAHGLDDKELAKALRAFKRHIEKGIYKPNTASLFLLERFGIQKNGKPKHAGVVEHPLGKVQFEVYLSGEKGYDDYGSQLLMWTGSWQFNVRCRSAAMANGWKMSQYGLFDGDKHISAGKSEQEILEMIGMDYLEPEKRK